VSKTSFVICAPEDAEAGATVRGWLEADGVTVLAGGPPGEGGGMAHATLQAVGAARAVVVLLSEHAEASDLVGKELLYALNNGRALVPVQTGALSDSGWMRFLTEGPDRIDARPALRETVRAAVLAAVERASAAGPVIAMLNIKGGVGKTVLTANLFAAAHMLDRRSIAYIDLDPQHNLTQYFLSQAERHRRREANQTLYSVFAARGAASIAKEDFAALPAPLNRHKNERGPKLDLILGDERLFEFTLDMAGPRDKEEAFARFHALVAGLRKNYDAVVIDTNPCATFLTRCAITAADHIVAPVRPDKYSLSGLNLLEQVTRLIRQRPVTPDEFTVILNAVGERPRLAGGDIDHITREEIAGAPFFGQALLPIAVPFSTMLRAPLADKYAANPINTTAIMRFSQRALKETLTAAAAAILTRASNGGRPVEPMVHAPLDTQDA
jgi:cellulose biosynthesis protein BcsQ